MLESERSCIVARGINFASFHDFSVGFGTVQTVWCCSSCCIAIDVNIFTILSLLICTNVSLVILFVITESPGNQEIFGIKSMSNSVSSQRQVFSNTNSF